MTKPPVSNLLARLVTAIWTSVSSLLWPSLTNVAQAWGYPIVDVLPIMFTESQTVFTTFTTRYFDAAEDAGISGSWLGAFPQVYLRDPSIFHQVFVENAKSVTRVGPEQNGPFGIVKRTVGDITVTADNWRRWRAGLLGGYSHPASLKKSYEGIFNIAQRHVERMMLGNTDTDSTTDLRHVMGDYALDTLWYAASQFLMPVPRSVNKLGNSAHLYWHALRNLLRGKPFSESDESERKLGEDIQGVVTTFVEEHLNYGFEKKPGETRYTLLKKVSQASGGTATDLITPDVLSQARQVYAFGHEASEPLLFYSQGSKV